MKAHKKEFLAIYFFLNLRLQKRTPNKNNKNASHGQALFKEKQQATENL